MSVSIKICGITRVEDALTAARLGAHALGFVFYGPSPRFVSAEAAAAIIGVLPPFVTPVGVFVDSSPEEVHAIIRTAGLQMLQFHGSETPAYCRQLGLRYLKAVRVRPGVDLLQYAAQYSDAAGLLLDAYNEGVPGGSGETFDWDLIPPALSLPVVLSGGLNPENVTQAVMRVRPWAVDVSSGVEAAKGIKDAEKMAAFIAGVRHATL